MRSLLLAVTLLLLAHTAQATDISVVGLFPGKAVLVLGSAEPRTYGIGDRITEGVQLVATSQSSATFIIQGKRETLQLGQHIAKPSQASVSQARAILEADSRGHFVTTGQINGTSIKMMVDTGATIIALSANDAARIGLNYRQGLPSVVHTANGSVPVYMVKLNSVKVGDIELNQIDAAVHENTLPFALLGMSFLNRTDMRREGDQMTLIKRY